MRALPPPSRAGWLRLAALVVFLLGVCAGAFLYATSADDAADDATNGAAGYVSDVGGSYAVAPSDSRAYRRSLEYFGGKSALEMAELREWFAGLFLGASLAFLVAGGAALVAGGLLFIARRAEEDDGDTGAGGG